MKSHVLMAAIGGAVCALGVAELAAAQEYMAPVRPSVFRPNAPEPHSSNLVTAIGISASLGGSVNGFTGSAARAYTATGGGWNARLTVGTRSFIAGEVAYVGTIQDVDAIGLDDGAQLLSNGGEALARLNLLPGLVQPYVVGGGAIVNYRLVNDDFNTSSIDGADTMVQFPVGAGVAFRYEGLVIDGRGTYRPVIDDDMFAQDTMATWSANLSGGFEF